MPIGRNPYVAKAENAEQKAAEARDDIARVSAHRDAAHQWDRAAERERPGKQRDTYERNAARNRDLANGDADPHASSDDVQDAAPVDPRLMN